MDACPYSKTTSNRCGASIVFTRNKSACCARACSKRPSPLLRPASYMNWAGTPARADLIAATEIERDHGVYVGQTYGRVFLVDLSGVAPSRKAAIPAASSALEAGAGFRTAEHEA